jgi:hypothetical protein
VTTAGYLNRQGNVLQGIALYPTDIIDCIYSYVELTHSGSYAVLTSAIGVNGQVTLTQYVNSGDVLLPAVSGDFAVFNGTTGQIKDSGYLPSNPTKTNIVMANAATVANSLVMATDTEGTIGDAAILASNVVVKNAVNTMAAAGNIILAKAFATEAANAVTASAQSGIITTSALTTAGGSSYAITWTNTFIASTSVVLLSLMVGSNTTKNITMQATVGTGTSTITIFNNTAATALNGTVIIGFLVV